VALILDEVDTPSFKVATFPENYLSVQAKNKPSVYKSWLYLRLREDEIEKLQKLRRDELWRRRRSKVLCMVGSLGINEG
jgi:hypothetical protein